MSPRLFLHGDSIVSPSFHSPRRLDGLSGSTGRLPAGSYSLRFASLSSLRGGKKDVPVRGPLLRSYNLAPRLHEDYGSHFRHPPQLWTIDSSWPLQNSSLVYLGVEIRSLPFLARPPPDESAISCDYSRSFCQPHLLQRPSGIVSWASRTIGISWTTSFRSPGSLSVESFFSGGLEWSSCVKEYLSLFQSQMSASYQTLRMWVAGPHWRIPRLGPLVSSSEDSLHQPERAFNSSVRPEGLRTPVCGPVGSSVLQQHHHSSVCPSPAEIHYGLVQCHIGCSQAPHMVIGSDWTLHQKVVDQLVHKWPAVIRLSATSLTARLPVYFYRPPIRG